MIKEFDQRVGLAFTAWIGGKAAAQIAEARRRDDPVALFDERRAEAEPLVEAAAGAVDHQQRLACPDIGVLEIAEALGMTVLTPDSRASVACMAAAKDQAVAPPVATTAPAATRAGHEQRPRGYHSSLHDDDGGPCRRGRQAR